MEPLFLRYYELRLNVHNEELQMTKRRKISEIGEDMFKIINQKPTEKEIEELSENLNEIYKEETDSDFPDVKIAMSNINKGNIDGHEQNRL